MSRSAAAFDGRGRHVTVLASALVGLLASLADMALRAAPEPEPRPAGAESVTVAAPARSALLASPTLAPGPTHAAAATPLVAAAIAPADRTRSDHADMPYRFLGKSVTGTETSIVLFGRGRVVALQGPGPVDDDYTVDAVFDDYIVLRHGPTGVGTFLRLALQRQALASPRDPEEFARD